MVNSRILKKLEENVEKLKNTRFQYIWVFLGREKKARIRYLWQDQIGNPKFQATMSRNRYKQILQCLTMDAEETRRERQSHDRFARARNVFNLQMERCKDVLVPGPYICVDETLYPTKNRFGFRVCVSEPKLLGSELLSIYFHFHK